MHCQVKKSGIRCYTLDFLVTSDVSRLGGSSFPLLNAVVEYDDYNK